MEHTNNIITLRGELEALPEFSHENHGRQFYRFELNVTRLSGTVDTLPVIAEASLLEKMDLFAGEMIAVTGQIRSHNIRADGSRRLLIFIFAGSVTVEDGEPMNHVLLEGPLCREPSYRRTPLGREICDAMLAVPRAFRRADYIPCIFWGKTANEIANCHTRDHVRICGRLQSRRYTKLTDEGPEERIAYEVSALSGEYVPNL